MKDLLEHILQNVDYEQPGWDDEFYVSISKAAELSGLSESQIRYFESLSGINIGQREGPKERNRVYTKRDVRLLQAVYRCKEARPAEIAEVIKSHQEQILERLEQFTLPQIIQHEEAIAGYHVLITGLVALLLSIWQEAATPPGTTIEGIIFGPQKESWKASFLQSIESKGSLDLADSLVACPTGAGKARTTDLKIFYSKQSWYLPYMDDPIWDTRWFADASKPFAIAVQWRRSPNEIQEQMPSLQLDERARALTTMLIQSLKNVLNAHPGKSGDAVSVYSRASLGPVAVAHGLSLMLRTCIQPYFSNCYTYVAKFEKDNDLRVLEQGGDPNSGYIPQFLNSSQFLDTRRFPWWIAFAKEQVSIALDQDASRRPESREEHGSVVCIPLVGQDKVVGVLGVENTCTDHTEHCLKRRDGFDGPELLRYLVCMAEIAADYLNHQVSSLERFERSQLAYTRHETTEWHWNIYQQGGLNYTRIVEKILDWTEQIGSLVEKTVNVVVIDIAEEDILAREHKGFDIIINLLQRTRLRIKTTLQSDPTASSLISKNQLVLFDEPVADHLVLVTIDIPRDYLRVILERIKRIWLATSDKFVWGEKEVAVSLQVGVCRFPSLGYERGIASEMMKHHLWMMSQQMFAKMPLEHVLEYDAVVVTE
ncbi:MAG TPA: MerR family transcriptional regulator [Ktedonobacteraceae bacterium]|nr:MerR family transcriptional regulator [Ktedonobacteraceae bacterium]